MYLCGLASFSDNHRPYFLLSAKAMAESTLLRCCSSAQNIVRIPVDKKKEWYYVIMDICILQMSYEEAAKHLNIEVQVLRARLYRARRYFDIPCYFHFCRISSLSSSVRVPGFQVTPA